MFYQPRLVIAEKTRYNEKANTTDSNIVQAAGEESKMAIREIRKFQDEVLRKKCKTVETVDDHVRKLLDDLADTLYATPNSAGLAANQVGLLRRLVVIDVGEGLLKLVNPEIIEADGEQLVIEGCLSFPDVWGEVKRPKRVVVQALNENGETIQIESCEELLTKCLCHEIDHLNGEVFVDKVTRFVKIEDEA